MKFKLEQEQQLLQDSARRYIDKAYTFESRTAMLRSGEGANHWQAFADNGWLAAAIPEAYGGMDGSIVDSVLIAQELGRGLVVEPFVGSAVLATQTFLAAASETQKAALVPALADGSQRLALAFSEPESRGSPAFVTLRAIPGDDGYRLTGCKSLVLGGVAADHYLVSARTSGEASDSAGISLFLVEAGAPGLHVQALALHDGSQVAELTFDGVRAGPASLVGDLGCGLSALRHGLAQAVAALCAEQVGAMERAIEITSDYLKVRQQFGVPIGTFQALQHRMADMAADLELARSMLFALLASMENDEPAQQRLVASQAKSLVVRLSKSVCGNAIQLHGGIGMTEECAVGHYFKRAIVAETMLGSSDMHDAECAAIFQGR